MARPEYATTSGVIVIGCHVLEIQVDQAGQHRVEKKGLKAKAVQELIKFIILFAYLWIIFLVFFVHEWIVLAHNHIGFKFYGLAALNSLVLAKIMLIAEDMRFTKAFERGSLISPIAYKSALFSVLLISAYLLEEIIVGAFRGIRARREFPPHRRRDNMGNFSSGFRPLPRARALLRI